MISLRQRSHGHHITDDRTPAMTHDGTHETASLDGTETTVYVARPDGAAPYPAVLVVHEVFGLNDDVWRIADRFAGNGCLAVAPELMPDGRIRGVVRSFRQLSAGPGLDGRPRAGGPAVGRRREDVERDRVGVTGFSMAAGSRSCSGWTTRRPRRLRTTARSPTTIPCGSCVP